MGCRIVGIRLQRLFGRFGCQIDLALGLAHMQMERVLEMRERHSCVASGKGRIEKDGSGEKPLCLAITIAGKEVHVAKPAMVRLPRIKRGGWQQQGPVAFDDINFRIEPPDDLRGQAWRRRKGIDGVAAEFIGPEDAVTSGVDELHGNKIFPAVASEVAGCNILRVHQAGCRTRRLASQRKGCASGNDADASQLGKAEDDVAGDAVGVGNVFRRRREWHQQERWSACGRLWLLG